MKYLRVSLAVLANSGIMLYAEVSTEFYALMEKASAGDAEAQYEIAVSYDHGDLGVEKDTKESFEWYLKAAEQGHIEAQCSVGWAYKNGEGVKKNAKQAFEWYLKAAEQEDARAQYEVGKEYVEGEGVEKDLKRAVEWISQVDINEAPALLWVEYEMDKHSPSVVFMELKEKASTGDVEALYGVGLAYDHGKGVKKNPKTAFKWYLKAAERGHAMAQFKVGESYSGNGDYSEDYNHGYLGYFGLYGDSDTGSNNDSGDDDFYHRDAEKAFKWYLKAAEQEHVEAQYQAGVLYEYADGVEQDLQASFEWYLKAAKQGHVKSQYDLAWAYENGRGVKKDLKKAFGWHLKAAEQGYENAQHKVGEAYFIGKGVEKDAKKSFRWYLKASWTGKQKERIEEAKVFTSRAYDLIKVSEQDPKKTFAWCLEAAQLEEYGGYREAQYDLGVFYANGKGVEQDLEQAFEWYLKASETMYGETNPRAQYEVGKSYIKGTGIEKNLKKAAEWISLVDKKEVPEALGLWEKYKLVKYNTSSSESTKVGVSPDDREGVEEDTKKAFERYLKAAEQGDAEAQCKVGSLYENGKGVEEDTKKALEWYLKAVKQGHAEAQYSLGLLYAHGNGVEKDVKKALKWYLKAAEQGHAGSRHKLGSLYEEGEDVEEDVKKAFAWYLKAAEQGYAKAQYKVGFLYEEGEGVEEDAKKAFEWYLKAAEQGHAESKHRVGLLYEYGKGVEIDTKKAFEWRMNAVEQEHIDGNGYVFLYIANAYRSGDGVKRNSKKALESVIKHVCWIPWKNASGDITIGDAYLKEGSPKAAFAHYIAAFHEAIKDSRYTKSAMFIDRSYDLARRLDKEPKEAFEWYLEAAELDKYGDCLQNQYDLGVAYANGYGVEKDLKKAAEWISKIDKKIMPEAAEIWEKFELEKFR